MCKKFQKVDFVKIFISFSLMCIGLFHEFLACAAGVVLAVYLCIYALKNKNIKIYINLTGVAVLMIVLFYGLSTFWAIDSGSAIIGFFKFLPVLLFLLVLMQQKTDCGDYFDIVTYVACFMTVVSSILMQFSALSKWFSVSGRLAGFFQYSNTFAVFLLFALVAVITKTKHSYTDFVMIPILLFGIIYSGSRTAFVLTLSAVCVQIIFDKNKKRRLVLLSTVVLIVSAAVLYAAVTHNFNSVGRFLTISLSESTFVGRFLYFKDALPVILKHPFGLGYMGYNYLQYSFQTGVYTVRFIHNDFLQLMLDIGWLPTAVFIAAIIKSFFKKGVSIRKRLLLFVVCAHTLFDFNFQYVAFFMLFILLLDYKDGEQKEISVSKFFSLITASVVSLLFIYMSIAQALSYFKQHELSNQIYPWNTQNHIAMLTASDESNKEKIADKIIKDNGYVALAYNVKAHRAYSKGDFKNVIKFEKKAITVSPFTYEAYEEYCRMLINGIYLYEKSGDKYSADVCRKELKNVSVQLASLPNRQSELGKMIKDQPKTELPDEIIKYIEAMDYEK